MANMLYNGVELPNINEVWTDKDTYPYAYVVDYLPGSCFYLYMVSEPCFIEYLPQYSADFLCGPSSYMFSYYEFHYTSSPLYSGIWELIEADRNTHGSLQNVDLRPLIWASSDVINTADGTVYLAASDPVDPNAPAYTYDRTAFLSGLAMGLIGKGNPTFEGSDTFTKGYLVGAELRAKRVLPVAYLYNGKKLPKLPKLPYEYAVIECFEDDDGVIRYGRLICSSEPIISANMGLVYSGYEFLGDVLYFGFVSTEDYWNKYFGIDSALPSNEWVKIGENHFDESTFEKHFLVADLMWANHNVYYKSGELKIAASDPVPVYE